ncbi:ABC transporter substrate-binding protein [Nocardiopsis salina]|uniref:ABC transporter substrate-binding protein n=1 Tax=Nocardiopsis salina TaxID=245836 RepID=UPI000347EF63|nr:sugar ABC transporter substrate-binding protein [Nocardiopsis salina]
MKRRPRRAPRSPLDPRYRTPGTPRTPDLSRRRALRLFGSGGAALAGGPLLSACGVGVGGLGEGHANGASEVTGAFDWRKAEGAEISFLQTPHPYQAAFQPLLEEFTELTGITVNTDQVAEADYYTRLNTELASGSGNYDVFMTGAYFLWTYGPPGWMEDLGPWIGNDSATSDEYDFDDVFEGLRTSTAWDFEVGSPLGTGGQWAIPWGFETNVICYNKAEFDRRGVRPAETFDELFELAVDLTDRSEGTYGLAFRGSRSWATIHPGFMTQFTREGCADYSTDGGTLSATMNSDAAVGFTRKWIDLAREAGPTSWTTYDYPDCTADLGSGAALMVFDADSATYPQNIPGNSASAGDLAWHPGPAGPDGNLDTSLWAWCLAMNSASRNKLAAWLFIQWATGKEAQAEAVRTGEMGFANPTRESVFEEAFKPTLDAFPGYQETFERVIDSTRIHFTPQTQFFETTENWAVALQDIYAGQDAEERLDELAEQTTELVNRD